MLCDDPLGQLGVFGASGLEPPHLKQNRLTIDAVAGGKMASRLHLAVGHRQKTPQFTLRYTQRQLLVLNSRLLEEID